MNKLYPVGIRDGDKALDQAEVLKERKAAHPAPEDEFGGGDICSIEEAPPTDDDRPLS